MKTRPSLTGIILFILVIAVSASVTEKFLRVPLLEVGNLWYRSFCTLTGRIMHLLTTWPDFYAVTTYALLAMFSVGLYYLYMLMFVPLNRIRILGDLGYVADSKFSMKEIANSVRKRRVVGDIPPVYPNGWFGLLESHSLKKGESVNLSILGKYGGYARVGYSVRYSYNY